MKKILNSIGKPALAMLLSIATLLTFLPLSVFALVLQDAAAGDSAPYSDEPFELIDLREENAKYFQNTDGTRVVAVYDAPVHYRDEDGVWQDIDNTLAKSGDEYATSDARVKFAKKITGNEALFTLHEGSYKITVALSGANKKVSGKVAEDKTEHAEDATQLQKMMTLDKLKSSIVYADILEGVDLEYIVSPGNIKENIVVKERLDRYLYTFKLSLNGLQASIDAHRRVLLYDASSGETVYVIPAGFMIDAAGSVSQNVEYELTDCGNGAYLLTVIADSAWINAAERSFPVKIDPSFTVEGASATIDLQITQNYPNRLDHDAPFNYISKVSKVYWKAVTLPTLSSCATIISAEFSIYVEALYLQEGQDSYDVIVHQVETDWGEDLTWNKAHASEDPQGKVTESEYFRAISYSNPLPSFSNMDITSQVKSWYAGQNYGLCIAPQSTTADGGVTYSSNESNTQSQRPRLTIQYKDIKGLEDYWSYATQDVGFAGSGAINYASGQLTFAIPTLTATDSLFSFTPTLYYNTSLAGKNAVSEHISTSRTEAMEPYGFQWNMSEALVPQEDRYIWLDGDGTEHAFDPISASSTVYRDEDGKLLTLSVSASTATITDSNHTVREFTSAGENGYYLSAIVDQSGNTLSFSFDSGLRPTSVNLTPKDSAVITLLNIYYNDEGMPYLVLNRSSGEAVVFRYSTIASGGPVYYDFGYLRQVIRAHGSTDPSVWSSFYASESNESAIVTVDAVADYEYTIEGHLYRIVNGLSQYKVAYTYDLSNRIEAVSEAAGVGFWDYGQEIRLVYNDFSTQVQTFGKDDMMYTADDILTTYCYDTSGRVVTTYTTNIDQTQFYGATHASYDLADSTLSLQEMALSKNSIKSSVVSSQYASNYLLNGGFEASSTALSHWSLSGAVALGTPAKEGRQAARLTSATAEGSASLSQSVSLKEGDYTLSLSLRTEEAQSVRIFLKAISATNSAHTVTQEVPRHTQDSSGAYHFASVSFSALPSGATTEQFHIVIEIVGLSTSGVLVDAVMLSKTPGAAEFDMITMGHFEPTHSATSPLGYWESDAYGSIEAVDSGNPLFGQVLHVTSAPNGGTATQLVYEASAAQRAAYDASGVPQAETTLTLSGWGRATGQTSGIGTLFAISMRVEYYDGTDDPGFDELTLPFDKDMSGWQLRCDSLVTDPAKGIVDNITVVLYYYNQYGDAYFDNICLMQDSSAASIYNYNNIGRLSEIRTGTQKSSYTYDESGNLIKEIGSDKTMVKYAYDSANRLIEESHYIYTAANPSEADGTESLLSRLRYAYNAYGLPTSSSAYEGETTSTYISTLYAYEVTSGSRIFGALTSQSDSLGNTTRYFYHQANGRLLAVTYPAGNGVSYTYDGMGNLTAVYQAQYAQSSYTSASEASVTYQYQEATKWLDSIVTDSTKYTFTYDYSFGNVTGIAVGEGEDAHSIVGYTYRDNNGKLHRLTYANGFQLSYVYDHLDRIAEIQYNIGEGQTPQTVYSYEYDAAGRLYAVTDHLSGQATLFRYNAAGQLLQSYVYDTQTHSNLLEIALEYDAQQRLSRVSHFFGYATENGTALGELHAAYTYNTTQGALSKLTLSPATQTELSTAPVYDNYGRLVSQETRAKTPMSGSLANIFYRKVSYTYVTSGAYDSARVASYSVMRGTGYATATAAGTYYYTYDANGNITGVSDGSSVLYRYTYDSLDQLIREDNAVLNKSFVYAYDAAGNITSKTTYAYTTGTLGTALSVQSYTYGDAAWGDLLTQLSKDGSVTATVRYDSVGNPIRIEKDATTGVNLTWNGRRLMAYTGYGNTTTAVSYTYNDEGIRTSKTVNGVRHDYLLDGSRIISETWAEHTMLYLYDETGAPFGLGYRNTSYEEGLYEYFFFEKNLQGDVIAIYNAYGTRAATYNYDAWGNCTVTDLNYFLEIHSFIVQANPFRYRGYYYDTDTGLYYLQSRYYNPEWGRFISFDDVGVLSATPEGLTDKNLYAYCDNNPIIRVDNGGEFWHVIAGALIGGAFEVGSQLIANGGDFTEIHWGKVGIAVAVGGITSLCGPLAGAIISGLGNAAIDMITQIEGGSEIDYKKNLIAFGVGAGSSLIGYGAGKVAGKIGGKIKINNLSKQSPGTIKRTILNIFDVPGKNRNTIKNLEWTLTQPEYKNLGEALLGKTIPQIFNSVAAGVSGYGAMGGFYGFR